MAFAASVVTLTDAVVQLCDTGRMNRRLLGFFALALSVKVIAAIAAVLLSSVRRILAEPAPERLVERDSRWYADNYGGL